MNQHLGATYVLSVAIVVAFAVLLHKSESPAKPTVESAPPTQRTVNRTGPRPVSSAPLRSARAEPVATVRPLPSPPTSKTKPASVVIQTSFGVKAASEPAVPRAAPPRTPKTATRRGGFATVGRGESLGDVAARVYGSATAADGLWRSNRDQLPTRDAPLREGMLLRTP